MRSLSLLFCVCIALAGKAQFRQAEDKTVTYDELYDSPYEINKLFVGFIPLYSDMFVTNINAGFGLDVSYYLADKLDFKASGRLPYYRATDFTNDLAVRTRETQTRLVTDNEPNTFTFFDLAVTYHIMDFEVDSESKVALYSKSNRTDRTAARVPTPVRVPNKKRMVVGARAGGFYYTSSSHLNRALNNQGLTLRNDSLAVPFVLNDSIFAVGNLDVGGFFIGASWTRIKNYAARPTKTYGDIIDDMIFTAYADLMIAPFINLEDVEYTRDIMNPIPGGPTTETIILSTADVAKNLVGFRFGVDGKFNRTLGWGWNAEMGYRPGLQTRGFYMMLKLAFPLYSTPLDYEIEAFGK